jgi:ribosomal protein L2
MALVKMKPTSPGRRGMVKVVNADLYKGRPFAALVEKKSKTAGRNNNGHITTRHIGGGHKQHYRVSTSSVTKMVSLRKWNVSNTILTVPRTSLCCATPTAPVHHRHQRHGGGRHRDERFGSSDQSR